MHSLYELDDSVKIGFDRGKIAGRRSWRDGNRRDWRYWNGRRRFRSRHRRRNRRRNRIRDRHRSGNRRRDRNRRRWNWNRGWRIEHSKRIIGDDPMWKSPNGSHKRWKSNSRRFAGEDKIEKG